MEFWCSFIVLPVPRILATRGMMKATASLPLERRGRYGEPRSPQSVYPGSLNFWVEGQFFVQCFLYSQMLVVEHLGSQTIQFSTKLFMEKKCLSCLTPLGLNSLPSNPFVLIPLWSITYLSGDKGDGVFKKVSSQTVSWNKLSWRTEVPVYSALKLEQRSGGSGQAHRQAHRQNCLFVLVKYLNHRTL